MLQLEIFFDAAREAFYQRIEARAKAEPEVAAYFLSGMEDDRAWEWRDRLAQDAPHVIAYGLRGVGGERAGTIDLPIGDDEGSRIYVRRKAGHGKPARTMWAVERRFRHRTLLRVLPETGRRHQIRVHLAAIGHPVLGDLLYGRGDEDYLTLVREGRDVRVAEGGPRRQLLHCARLVFDDPSSSGRVEVVAPLPADFGV